MAAELDGSVSDVDYEMASHCSSRVLSLTCN